MCSGVVSGLVWFWLSVAAMSGGSLKEALQPSLLWMVLSQTQPGMVWLGRTGLFAVLAIVLMAARAPAGWAAISWPSLAGAMLSVLLTGSLAWLGHAGATEGPQAWGQLCGDVLHLVAAGIWPAGLAPFALFLRCMLRTRPLELAGLPAACVATRRFSALSFYTVGALTLSGAVNGWYLVGSFHALVETAYGRLLLLKLGFFGVMIAVAAANLLLLKPKVMPASAPFSDDRQLAALARIERNVLIEIVVGTLVLLVVGWLGVTAPAIHT